MIDGYSWKANVLLLFKREKLQQPCSENEYVHSNLTQLKQMTRLYYVQVYKT